MIKRWILLCSSIFLSAFAVPRTEAAFTVCQHVFQSSEQPSGLAVDQTHASVWVAMFAANEVVEFSQSNCATIRTVGTGNNPNGVTFDGTNVWVTNFGSNTVTKINASTGAVIGTYAVGANPRGVAYDGFRIWVANNGNNTVSQIDPATGRTALTCSVGSGPYFLAFNPFDGNVYIPNLNGNTVTVMHNQSCTPVRTISTDSQPVFASPDGAGNMWVSCYNSQKVDEISTSGVVLRRVSAPHSGPTGLTYSQSSGLVWGTTNSGYIYSINSAGIVGNVLFRGGGPHSHYDIASFGLSSEFWSTDIGSNIVELLHE
jgi:YVTN family beta-propeller protein